MAVFYFAIRCKNTAGVILPLSDSDWLNWSSDKDDTLGLVHSLCHKIQNP